MAELVRFGHNIFGYTTLVREDHTFVTLTGEGEQRTACRHASGAAWRLARLRAFGIFARS